VIHTEETLEAEVSRVGGTWVKRRNTRNRLTKQANNELNEMIEELRREIRLLKAQGATQYQLALLFSRITQIEMRLL